MQISIEYLRWLQFVCVARRRVTVSVAQDGILAGTQWQQGSKTF